MKVKKSVSQIKRSKPFKRNLVMGKALKSTWQNKMKVKAEIQAVKQFEAEIKAAKQVQIEEKKRRREENKKHREENARKAEIVQPIKNLRKLKRIAKRKLRKVENYCFLKDFQIKKSK